jgi:tape measure domain-containing protein
VAGTAVAAGIFGGPEAAIGAVAGGIAGGLPGAQIGASVGAVVSSLRQQAAAVATNVAEINKYRIALAGVSTNQKDYNVSIKDVTSLSRAYLLPLKDATQQYTQLKASIVGAGGSTEQTTKVFRGIAAAIVGTGGNAESLNAALRATAQVFSKGKVSAEELRQQIGERLPGAFSIFAQAIGKTPQQLDKALEDGKVTLADFLKFSDELYKRYGETAQTLADAPENAGQRLKVALDFATHAFGGFFQTVGAGFQSYFRGLTEFVLQNETTIKRVITILAVGFSEIGKLIGSFAKFFVDVFNAAFTLILGNLETVLSRVEEAINRAKAVQTLTPEKITQAQQQASIATADKFGVRVGGFNTRIIIDTQGAEKEYNTTFNSLIDSATKAAGATNYTKRMQGVLFPEFTPDKFGAGVGNVQGLGTDPGGADGGGTKKNKGGAAAANALAASRQRTEVLKQETVTIDKIAAFQEKINNATRIGNQQAALTLAYEQDRAKIQGEFGKQMEKLAQTDNRGEEAKALLSKTQAQLEALALDNRGKMTALKLQESAAGYQTLTQLQQEDLIAKQILAGKGEEARLQVEIANTIRDVKDPALRATLAKQIRANAEAKKELTLAENLKQIYTDLGMTIKDGVIGAIQGAIDGTKSLGEAAAGVLRNIANRMLDIAVNMALFGSISGMGSKGGGLLGLIPGLDKRAKGGVYAQNGIQAFARGGIVNGPTLFPFAKGIGLMGEAGPEAIMPLRRGRDGNLGVMSSGGGTTNVVVNVDASGSSVEGDQSQAKALGNAISAAVQSELVKQKRPGGLLA